MIFEGVLAAGAGRVNQNGLFLLGPTLMEYGTDAQRARFLPPMATLPKRSGVRDGRNPTPEAISLRSRRARRVTGMRGCSTGEDVGVSRSLRGLDVRSVPLRRAVRTASRSVVHRCPLDAPGVTVRPIRQLDSEARFAEVFLDDVRVPVEHAGARRRGWKVAMSTGRFSNAVSSCAAPAGSKRRPRAWCRTRALGERLSGARAGT